ncbi:hypothetical protein [Tianweitania sp.]|uniref:hypothetical protein n=1 Tax=Tianweitania sp. TaxID=2021634 RepID=UPI00289D54DC|nr:hypothetical protein [Tianweitania sp.]
MTDTDSMHDPLHERIHHFIEAGYFEEGTPSYGVALQVADRGVGSLIGGQVAVWQNHILPVLSKPMNDEERFQCALEQDREDEARFGLDQPAKQKPAG